MENIYIVMEQWGYDLESGSIVVAFDSEDKALKYKNNRVVEIKEQFNYDTIEDYKYGFRGYDKGYYVESHTSIIVKFLKVNQYDI